MATITKIDLDPAIMGDVYGSLWYVVVLHTEGMDLRALESALIEICGHTSSAARSLVVTVYANKSAIVAAMPAEEEALAMQAAFTSRNIKTRVSRYV